MKKAVLRHLKSKDFSLLSLNQFLYVLKQNAPILDKGTHGELQFNRFQILKTIKLESNIKYDVMENKDMVVLSEEMEKYVKFIKIGDLVGDKQQGDKLPEPVHQL